eukprot:m.25911 g.25911  ORF g.25911 m.25911 type:complete len:525 (-) comp8777_c0_seq3:218-1792(-)
MVSSWALCLCLSVCLATLPQTTGVPATKHIHIILVGANGNLAKKYLWQSWFDLTHSQSDTTAFQVWAGTRLSNDDAYTQLPNLIRSSIQTCPPEFDSSKCEAAINAFVEACAFVRLKTEHDYEELSSAIEHTSHREDGRLFYLSVPPSAYPFLAKTISTVARPSPSAWLRVVFEKPFGSDLSSAKELSEQLSTYLQEHEIYRIDHYLGKPGVQQIMQFKTENRQLFNKLFHSNRVQRVEIVSTEKEDCAGRTRFYNEYGVIRDIFQNHLTEILALVAMEIPDDTVSATHAQLKTRVLQSTSVISPQHVLVGQYQDYQSHVMVDHPQPVESRHTPTFAAATVAVSSNRWKGVPFVLVSGKQLARREAFVRLTLRDSSDASQVCFNQEHCDPPTITFHIQGGEHNASVALHGALPDFNVPAGWTISGHPGAVRLFPPQETKTSAYSTLVREVVLGRRENFVDTQSLLLAWKIWTPVVSHCEQVYPVLYEPNGKQLATLAAQNGMLRFRQSDLPTTASQHVADHQEL